MQKIVITYGRFNPPTIGHQKLIETVANLAANDTFRIYATQSQDGKKNPLPFELKVKYMRDMFNKYADNIVCAKKTLIKIYVDIYDEGFRDITLVLGEDRLPSMHELLNKYNGVYNKCHGYYKFDLIRIISAGSRDNNADGVEGMSASKLRNYVRDRDYESFCNGLPADFTDSEKLYDDLKYYLK